MTMMLLTLAFTRPVAGQELQLTLFSGYLAGTETYQSGENNLIIDRSGSGNSTLGTFTITYHAALGQESV